MSTYKRVYGYGIELANLKLLPDSIKQTINFNEQKVSLQDYFKGQPHDQSIVKLARGAINPNVAIFNSNIKGEGTCVLYIPQQIINVGADPNSVYIYTYEEANAMLFKNTQKIISSISMRVGYNNITNNQYIRELVETAKNKSWVYVEN